MYTTYGIKDPVSGLFIYVGQTVDFDKRKRAHLRRGEQPRPAIMTTNIKTWMHDTVSKGIIPDFVILDSTDSEEASLRSETEWVCRLAKEGHPLLNRWKKHRTTIKAYRP